MARCAPSREGALGLFHLPTRLATLVLAQYQRVPHSEGPTLANSLFLSALASRRPRGQEAHSIALTYAQAAEAVGCQVKGISPETLLGQHFHPIRPPHPQGFPSDHLLLHRVAQKPDLGDLAKHGCHKGKELVLRFPGADLLH